MSTLDRYTCEQTFRRLDDYLDRELDAVEVERVERHLATCVDCASEFEFERAVIKGLKDKVRRIEAPRSAIDAVRDVLESHRKDPSWKDSDPGVDSDLP